MARDIPVANVQILVAYDQDGLVRDLYFPHIGQDNHVNGAIFRVGIWEDGVFEWLPAGWQRRLDYLSDTLVTDLVWSSDERGLSVTFNDLVDFHDPLFLRKITVRNVKTQTRQLRLFLGFDFSIAGNDIGDTASLRPESGGLLHYKNDRYFLINALLCGRHGFDQVATGNKRRQEYEGTWKDAEDGVLSGNAIAQGSVDSVVALHLTVEPVAEETAWLWIAMGKDWGEVRDLNQRMLRRNPARLFQRTHDYWRLWAHKEPEDDHGLPEAVMRLYRRSLLVIRTQIDRNGAILAANDSDNVQYNRDTYSYVWPRDGALVAHALDRAGYPETSQAFFKFCASVVDPAGYFLHKYTPSGMPASSWHPWVKDARGQLPIQEDETALVIWALWEHYRRFRDIEFITPLYRTLIKNGANFLMNYRDSATNLPLASYDLWEERQSVQTFTVSAVHGGLMAAANFMEAFGEKDLAKDYRTGAALMKAAVLRHLFISDIQCFARGVVFPPDGSAPELDRILDASVCGIFAYGMFPVNDPAVISTLHSLHQKLWCGQPVGGLARYENDPYYRSKPGFAGNPWFVTTLWYAQYLIACAQVSADLEPALKLLEWTAAHALPSGVLAEQLDPQTGAPLSVSPLTWSHAAYVTAVCDYRDKARHLMGGLPLMM